jgi:hypothetical protein
LNFMIFNGWSVEKEFVDFINKNNINQNDILKITRDQTTGYMFLFYYTHE